MDISSSDAARWYLSFWNDFRVIIRWLGAIVRPFYLSLMIPDCFSFPFKFHSRRITAVLVDHSSNVLEPVFCLVTEQLLPSTIYQRAQVDESDRTRLLLREFLATVALCINRLMSLRWHITSIIVLFRPAGRFRDSLARPISAPHGSPNGESTWDPPVASLALALAPWPARRAPKSKILSQFRGSPLRLRGAEQAM